MIVELVRIHPRPPRTPVSNGYRSFCFICLAKGTARVDSNSIDPPNSPAEKSPCATATTAASGRNREELLGLRPAGCACRPRHDAAAGSRDPGSFSARLATSTRAHQELRHPMGTGVFLLPAIKRLVPVYKQPPCSRRITLKATSCSVVSGFLRAKNTTPLVGQMISASTSAVNGSRTTPNFWPYYPSCPGSTKRRKMPPAGVSTLAISFSCTTEERYPLWQL